MYEPPQAYKKLIKTLDENGDFEAGQAALLVRVELGLFLLQYLGLADEPITALWIILSDTPIRDIRLQSWSEQQRRAIANARVLLPYSGRFSWHAALRDYSKIGERWCSYIFDASDLERQIVDASHLSERYPERFSVYRNCLESLLAYKEHKIKPADAGTYNFKAQTQSQGGAEYKVSPVTITLSETQAAIANTELAWFTQPRLRQPLEVTYQNLQDVAAYIDECENSQEWTKRVSNIRYCVLHQDEQGQKNLGQANTEALKLEGIAHIAGMVASGKSTLMTLLAAYAVWNKAIHWRITLVVGDTMSALKLADQLNCWFRGDSETNSPVAVAILGRSNRDRHLRQFHQSRNYRQDHWGQRWLNPACPLQSLIPLEQLNEPIIPGKEPCGALKKVTSLNGVEKATTAYSCPLFAICPSQQLYRDLPQAQIWVTTPGALGSSNLPPQIEKRNIKLGDLIYEQSDIVVFDEVDTVQEWFDALLAQWLKLTDNGNGLLDMLDVETAQYSQKNRITPPPRERWIGAERQSVTAVSQILRQINRSPSAPILQTWLNRGYFTALTLFYKLARRLVGLGDYEEPLADPNQVAADQKKIEPVMRHFDALLEVDPLNMPASKKPDKDGPNQLAQIMQLIMTNGDGTQIDNIQARCKKWILDFVPNIQTTLTDLQLKDEQNKSELQQKTEDVETPDTLETLAQRLAFILSVALLDRNIRIVLYEWDNRPETIGLEHPHRRSPYGLTDILPLPPTGRLFGTYYARSSNPSTGAAHRVEENRLSIFGYTNIGRWYIMNFHQLKAALEDQSGPHVIALSGTSYLPDSTRWHFDVPPQGVLQSEEDSKTAIAQSHFEFLPQYEEDRHGNGQALWVSGIRNKHDQVRKVAEMLVGNDFDRTEAPLRRELRWLRTLALENPTYWHDRDRLLLLVNSYDQARWATQTIASHWSEMSEKVFGLHRSEENGLDMLVRGKKLLRADIETFAETGGKILVAPMQAIGRGFNILNNALDDKKAAFGAIYFLTRPMPHPFDTQAIAQELNRRTLDWYQNEQFVAWQEDGLYQKGLALRREASHYWRMVENRSYYSRLNSNERRDLAATTAGLIIQAGGRLLRGGVPYHGYFVDAAWGPNNAKGEGKPDTPKTSLLAAVIEMLTEYSTQDVIGSELYETLSNALVDIKNFEWRSL